MSPSSTSADEGPLSCPRCAISYPLSERFCENCGMPLVYKGRGDEGPITDAHGRARKIRPQYSRGEPVWGEGLPRPEPGRGRLLRPLG